MKVGKRLSRFSNILVKHLSTRCTVSYGFIVFTFIYNATLTPVIAAFVIATVAICPLGVLLWGCFLHFIFLVRWILLVFITVVSLSEKMYMDKPCFLLFQNTHPFPFACIHSNSVTLTCLFLSMATYWPRYYKILFCVSICD